MIPSVERDKEAATLDDHAQHGCQLALTSLLAALMPLAVQDCTPLPLLRVRHQR